MIVPSLTASFPAFGSTITLTGVGVAFNEFRAGVEEVRRLSDDWDQQFSRFRADSLLTKVNTSHAPVDVTHDFIEVLDAALDGALKTDGRFDPAILPALNAAGYRHDFERIRGRPAIISAPVPSPGSRKLMQINIDREAQTVLLPLGIQLDFGGIAKGAFADRIASRLEEWPGGCIDVGGDLRVWGEAPDGPRWRVGVEHPCSTELDIRSVEIASKAASGVATSGVNRRHWETTGGQPVNHLIDPRTGRSVSGSPQSVTVFAQTATDAEVAATSALIAASRLEPITIVEFALAIVVWDDKTIDIIKGRHLDAAFIATPASHSQSA
ncbi:MAG TPA: FAD:protein FMN transferase [Thermomicrobiales bacterium]|nr:FAD:protein FMN transferase [Thermomicrobiales bacterium]